MTPGEQARAAVREQLRDVRVWLGETSPEHEQYIARHARQETPAMSITLQQARERIGAGVTYRPHPNAPAEDGEITAVSDTYVLVRYGRNTKATPAASLDFLNEENQP